MELRQLRYFITLADELHFGRAAAREHIVQSALSQQLQRLERELGTRLLERTTHHVSLTPVGSRFLTEARRILAEINRAVAATKCAAGAQATLWVGIPDASYDFIPRILHEVQNHYPDLEIHQIETCVPDQFKLLCEGRLDIGFGRAALAPPEVASQLVRLDPLGVLLPKEHRLSKLRQVPVITLADERLLLGRDHLAPELNQFIIELCRSVGFLPNSYAGSVESIRAAVELVAQGRCLSCVPSSCKVLHEGVTWKRLTGPVSLYPWSVLWHSANRSNCYIGTVRNCAHKLSRQLCWIQTYGGGEEFEGQHVSRSGADNGSC
jgi:DNA-binding transcriptional LysR family regulator